MYKTNHLRKTQSEKYICDALLELMKIKPFNDITITQLCEKAGISRLTFYRHFDHLMDVLDLCFDLLKQDIQMKYQFIVNQYDYFKNFYEGWYKHKEILQIFISQNMLENLLVYFMRDTSEWFENHGLNNQEHYLSNFVAISSLSILYTWMKKDFKETPEELAYISVNLFKNISSE